MAAGVCPPHNFRTHLPGVRQPGSLGSGGRSCRDVCTPPWGPTCELPKGRAARRSMCSGLTSTDEAKGRGGAVLRPTSPSQAREGGGQRHVWIPPPGMCAHLRCPPPT